MSIGAIMVGNHLHLSSPPSFKLLVEPSTEPFVHLVHNNCQPVHLLLAQSHLSPTFHADSTSHPDHFRCDSFLRFSHFPATLFRWDNNPALCGSRFLRFDPACGSHPILPFDGPCGPRFLPLRGETIRPERHPHHEERHLAEDEPVTPGCTRARSPFVVHHFPTTTNGELSNGLQLQICNNGLDKNAPLHLHMLARLKRNHCWYIVAPITFTFAFASFNIKLPEVGLILTSWVFVLVKIIFFFIFINPVGSNPPANSI